MNMFRLIVGCLVFASLVGCNEKKAGSAYPDMDTLKRAAGKAFAANPDNSHLSNVTARKIAINHKYRDGNRAYIRFTVWIDATNYYNGREASDVGYGMLEFLKSDDEDGRWVFMSFTNTLYP